jgi:hypothetical protein
MKLRKLYQEAESHTERSAQHRNGNTLERNQWNRRNRHPIAGTRSMPNIVRNPSLENPQGSGYALAKIPWRGQKATAFNIQWSTASPSDLPQDSAKNTSLILLPSKLF